MGCRRLEQIAFKQQLERKSQEIGLRLLVSKKCELQNIVTPGPSKLEKVVDPCSGRRGVHHLKSGSTGPRGPLPGSTTFSNFDGPGVSYMKSLNSMNWCNGKVSKSAKIWLSKIILFFY